MLLSDEGAWRAAMRQPHTLKRVPCEGPPLVILVIGDDGTINVFDPGMAWCGEFANEQQARMALRLPLEDAA